MKIYWFPLLLLSGCGFDVTVSGTLTHKIEPDVTALETSIEQMCKDSGSVDVKNCVQTNLAAFLKLLGGEEKK